MIRDTEGALVKYYHGRVFAYNRVFDRDNQFTRQVLEDLARFCRANDTSFHPDPRVHAQLEGRREVWLRIQQFLNLSAEELFELSRVKIPVKGATR